jgi:hypothetical protein
MIEDKKMNKILATLALALLFLAVSCTPVSDEQIEPLVLPYTLLEQEFQGNNVVVTLQTSKEDPRLYEFLMTAETAPEQTKFGVDVVTVLLTEGYQPEMEVDWSERIGAEAGEVGIWEGESLGGQELMESTGYGLGNTGEIPAAIFVRVVAGDANNTHQKTYGPLAVLQILPDAQGVIRLDQ